VSTVAVTMAGRGQRFRDAGYDVPKYEIEVHGRTLFRWALDSLQSWIDDGSRFVFLARAEDDASAFIARECGAAGIASHDVIELPGTTDGQATTALLARGAVRDAGEPFLVYNIDTHVRPGAMRAHRARGGGWIPVFPGEGDAWSFAAADDGGRVTEMREKVRISPHATVGLYWFGSFDLYGDLYERHWSDQDAEKAAGERYIAPMYTTLVESGADVWIEPLELDDVVPLGTPAEVDRFAAAESPAG
jgi:NDP-sugar pyrophosphorylase family protein